MRKVLLLAVVMVLCVALFATSACAVAPPSGFRGINWGDSASMHKDLVLYKNEGPCKTYKRQGEKLKIDDANLFSVSYFFVDDKFYMVIATIEKPSFSLVYNAVSAQWGKETERTQTENASNIIWTFHESDVMLSKLSIGDRDGLTILHKELWILSKKREYEYRKEKTANAGKDF